MAGYRRKLGKKPRNVTELDDRAGVNKRSITQYRLTQQREPDGSEGQTLDNPLKMRYHIERKRSMFHQVRKVISLYVYLM